MRDHNEQLDGPEWAARKRAYLKLLALESNNSTAGKEMRIAALNRAHELRKFEIENYWKRSIYFWGFQIVTFGVPALVLKDSDWGPAFALIATMLGGVTAFAAILSAKGSKFWQENWEAHVDFLEDDIEGRLHKTALLRTSGLSFSVSRVNEALLKALLGGWIAGFFTAVVYVLNPMLFEPPVGLPVKVTAITILSLLTWLGLIEVGYRQRSALTGRSYSITDFSAQSDQDPRTG